MNETNWLAWGVLYAVQGLGGLVAMWLTVREARKP